MPATDLASLHQEIADRQAIADLVARLGRMLDEHRFDEAPAILAEDIAIDTPGGTARGHEAVVTQARRNHAVRTHHVISDLIVELDGDSAQIGANVIVTFSPTSEEPGARLTMGGTELPESHLMLGERYAFEAVRTADGWRLASIATRRLWSSVPVVLGARIAEANGAAS
jgi:hypothetical protein